MSVTSDSYTVSTCTIEYQRCRTNSNVLTIFAQEHLPIPLKRRRRIGRPDRPGKVHCHSNHWQKKNGVTGHKNKTVERILFETSLRNQNKTVKKKILSESSLRNRYAV